MEKKIVSHIHRGNKQLVMMVGILPGNTAQMFEALFVISTDWIKMTFSEEGGSVKRKKLEIIQYTINKAHNYFLETEQSLSFK